MQASRDLEALRRGAADAAADMFDQGKRRSMSGAQRRRPSAGGSWRCGAAWVTVVFADQRLGGCPYGTGDATDVAPGVEIIAAGAEVVVLDVPDDCFPDTGLLADLRDGEAGLASCMCQGVTDIHPATSRTRRPAIRAGGRGDCNRRSAACTGQPKAGSLHRLLGQPWLVPGHRE
jgi:hypothetical protein